MWGRSRRTQTEHTDAIDENLEAVRAMTKQVEQIKRQRARERRIKAEKRSGGLECATCTTELTWDDLRKRSVDKLTRERATFSGEQTTASKLHVCRECGRILSTDEMRELGLRDDW